MTQNTKANSLHDDITFLKGVGPKRGSALKQNGIETTRDLLFHLPRKYLDRTNIKPIKDFRIGDEGVVIGRVISFGIKKTKKTRFFQLIISDDTGILNCIWFNGISWISEKFKELDSVACHGKIEFYNGYKMVHPEFDILDGKDDQINTGRIIPLYSSNSLLKNLGLDSRGFRKIINNALEKSKEITDYFDRDMLKESGLIQLNRAIYQIHNPSDIESLRNATYRIKFDAHFFLQMVLNIKRVANKTLKSEKFIKSGDQTKLIYNGLNFTLTDAQIRVLKEIRSDFVSGSPMNRLIQGDVGSGKTIVALLAASITIDNGFQVAFMAPTEILAEQHYNEINRVFSKTNITCELLIGRIKAKDKETLYSNISLGKTNLIIGTHALIQKDVIFNKLGLIIIDEQHRFGVDQRKLLIDKGSAPHVLAMTATPIPRTLAFTVHGDMEISIIDELPKNRIPIITKIMDPKKMNDVYNFIKKEIELGRQCFVVYPLIEESEKLDLKAAEIEYKNISENIFPNLNIGFIHGKMKKENIDSQMKKFENNIIRCMVSTTVIEVGINIPNASVMIIENADRFGLTQLHQLRGRIGRGMHQSYCILIPNKKTDLAMQRLKILRSTNDGFIIADEDLKIRGPGDFFGTKQHGYLKSKIINFAKDGKIIKHARNSAIDLLNLDPNLNNKKNKLIRDHLIEDYKEMLTYINVN